METIFSSGLFMRLIDRLVGESMTGNTGPLGHAHWIDHYVKVTHTFKGRRFSTTTSHSS